MTDDFSFKPIDAYLAASLARRFRLVRQLGAGGMGAVLYRAERRSARAETRSASRRAEWHSAQAERRSALHTHFRWHCKGS